MSQEAPVALLQQRQRWVGAFGPTASCNAAWRAVASAVRHVWRWVERARKICAFCAPIEAARVVRWELIQH